MTKNSVADELVLCMYCGMPSPDEAEICEACFDDRERADQLRDDPIPTHVPDVLVYEVGGSIRDEMMGLPVKDRDFSVEAPSYARMKEFLEDRGFNIFVETPQYLTIRAHFPKHHPSYGKTTADFVLCRKDGAYSDGRRPDEVTPGTIHDDLGRRDYTVNAMARQLGSLKILDPFNGMRDIHGNELVLVGGEGRLREDPLRALRALRFHVTKGFIISDDLFEAIFSGWFPPLLTSVSAERKREELGKMFKHDTNRALNVFYPASRNRAAQLLRDAVFVDGLWLRPTLEQ